MLFDIVSHAKIGSYKGSCSGLHVIASQGRMGGWVDEGTNELINKWSKEYTLFVSLLRLAYITVTSSSSFTLRHVYSISETTILEWKSKRREACGQ
jgi:hypothetical protein